jgi:Uma2 family endonuclease
MASPAITQLIEEPQRPITFEEYRALPDSDQRIELIRGELIMSASPKEVHQRVAFHLAIALQEHADARELGAVYMASFDVRFSDYTAVQPDVLFVSAANKDRLGEDYCDGPPDLVIEVLSPSNQRIDLVRKRLLYADYGVPEYWIVDPEARTISVNLLEGDHYAEHILARGALGSRTFPELRLDLDKLFSVRPWMAHTESDED